MVVWRGQLSSSQSAARFAKWATTSSTSLPQDRTEHQRHSHGTPAADTDYGIRPDRARWGPRLTSDEEMDTSCRQCLSGVGDSAGLQTPRKRGERYHWCKTAKTMSSLSF